MSPATIKNKNQDDHRYLPRWEIKNRVFFKKEDGTEFQRANSKDLSPEGLSFYTDEHLYPEQIVTLTLYLSSTVTIQVRGTVLWRELKSDRYLVGVRFKDTPQQVQDLILQHAFEIDKENLTRHWFQGWKE